MKKTCVAIEYCSSSVWYFTSSDNSCTWLAWGQKDGSPDCEWQGWEEQGRSDQQWHESPLTLHSVTALHRGILKLCWKVGIETKQKGSNLRTPESGMRVKFLPKINKKPWSHTVPGPFCRQKESLREASCPFNCMMNRHFLPKEWLYVTALS